MRWPSPTPTGARYTIAFGRSTPTHRVDVTAETVAARGPALVFCRTKRGADRLSQRLARLGLSTAPIHGDRSQPQRDRALAAFRAGRLDVLVATDVAARGIHVDAVPLVVHYDPPADATDYVHRSGRTGRAGADGIVVSLLGQASHRRGPATATTAGAYARCYSARPLRSPNPEERRQCRPQTHAHLVDQRSAAGPPCCPPIEPPAGSTPEAALQPAVAGPGLSRRARAVGVLDCSAARSSAALRYRSDPARPR